MNSQAMMITKVKNIYIMLLHAISKENISIVEHCLDDKLSAEFKTMVQNNIKNNVRQVYRQLNISNVNILEENDKYLTIEATTRYIGYLVDRKTDKYVSGDNKNRTSQTVILKFRKNTTDSKILFSCPNCGAGLNINESALCPYCNRAIDDRFSPYVLCSIT